MTQTEAVFQYIRQTYGISPDYPFAPEDTAAVLRHPANRKWFGIVMQVAPKRLGLVGEAEIPILNVKCDPLLMGSLLLSEGFLPGYHMNKRHWLTILLDGTVPAQDICGLLDMSYDLTKPKMKKRKKADCG